MADKNQYKRLRLSDKNLPGAKSIAKHSVTAIVFGILALVCALGILPAALFFYTNTIFLHSAFTLTALMVLASFISIIGFSVSLLRNVSGGLEELDHQIDSFNRGTITFSNKPIPFLTLEDFRLKLNAALKRYSSYRLAYKNPENADRINEAIKNHTFLPLGLFEEYLHQEIETNPSFRSAVLVIENKGERSASNESMEALRRAIAKAFPEALLGQYDDTRCLVYIPSVAAKLDLQIRCENFIYEYHDYHVSQIGDEDRLAYSAIGGAVFPYVLHEALIDTAIDQLNLGDGVHIEFAYNNPVTNNTIMSETAHTAINLAVLENYERAIKEKAGPIEEAKAVADYVRWIVGLLRFDTGGIIAYNLKLDQYEVLLEQKASQEGVSFAPTGTVFEARDLDPFFEAAEQDPSFAVLDTLNLPPHMRGFLSELGVGSIFFHAVKIREEKIGLAFAASAKPRKIVTLDERSYLDRFFSFMTTSMIALTSGKRFAQSELLLSTFAARNSSYIYTINRESYRLTYLSPNLQQAFPGVRLGDVCYKALRHNHTSPCSHCPLKGGVDKRIIDAIGPNEMTLSLLNYRGVDEESASMLIEKSATATGSSSLAENHLIDKMMLIKNAEAFQLDLNRQYKIGGRGYVLTVRLSNAKQLQTEFADSDVNPVMQIIARLLVVASHADNAYRVGDTDIAFLLPSYTKAKIASYAEEIASIVGEKMQHHNREFRPIFAYSAISYPNEADSLRGYYAIMPKEIARAEKAGENMLVQVDDAYIRKAPRDEYVIEVFRAQLEKKTMPFEVQPIYSIPDRKVRGGDLFVRLYGNDGVAIPPSEFLHAARKEGLVIESDLAMLGSVGKLYEENGQGALRLGGVNFLTVHFGEKTLLSEEFIPGVKAIYSRYHLPKNYVVFGVPSTFLGAHEDEFLHIKDELKGLGVLFEALDFRRETLSIEDLKRMGINRVKLPRNAASSASDSLVDADQIRTLANTLASNDIILSFTSVENQGEYDYVRQVEPKYAQGYHFSRPMPEKEFLRKIAYDKR